MTRASFTQKSHQLQYLRVGDLTVSWPAAQRALAEKRAKEIAGGFDPDIFGTLTVSPIAGGKYHVNDGWTRASAVRILYGDNERVPCVVVPASDEARAAKIFSGINGGRVKPTAMEMFHVAVTAQEEGAVAVNAVASSLGLRVEMTDSDGCIRAVSALTSIYKQYGEDGLRDTLAAIMRTWGRDAAGFDAHIMRGFALFLSTGSVPVDVKRLALKTSRKYTPGRLIGAAKATKEAFGGNLGRAVAALLNEAHKVHRSPSVKESEAAD